FEGWLWRITRNAFLDDVRRRKRRPTVALPEDDRTAFGSVSEPEDVLAETRLPEHLQQALLALPFDFREAVVMCDVVGLTYDEIAEATAIPVGTVRSRIHRGRKMLRGMLE
ncbi:MAG: sigma-70 family RNA polymerase sigma factor, partial [Acidobacteria bacterium]|nr:sigma-70 family RNA polymerase sigma factor [Acidobacteriota bacterium]